MKKIASPVILLLLFSNALVAQKGTIAMSINAGSTTSLTQSASYKYGIHLSSIFSCGVSSTKNDAATFGVGYHTIKFKYTPTGGLNMLDFKIGYRFFPSAKVPIYLHPNAGVGFYTGDYGGKKAQGNLGITLGYLPNVGNGNINVFAAYNNFRFSPNLSLLHLGLGYQFKLKGK